MVFNFFSPGHYKKSKKKEVRLTLVIYFIQPNISPILSFNTYSILKHHLHLNSLSRVRLFVTPWTIQSRTIQSMEFSRSIINVIFLFFHKEALKFSVHCTFTAHFISDSLHFKCSVPYKTRGYCIGQHGSIPSLSGESFI